MYGFKEEQRFDKWADVHTDISMQSAGAVNMQGVLRYEHNDFMQKETLPLDLSVLSSVKQTRDSDSPLDLSLKTRKRHADSTDSYDDPSRVQEIATGIPLPKRNCFNNGSSNGKPSPAICSSNTKLYSFTYSQSPNSNINKNSVFNSKSLDPLESQNVRCPVNNANLKHTSYLTTVPKPESAAAGFCSRPIKQEYIPSCMKSAPSCRVQGLIHASPNLRKPDADLTNNVQTQFRQPLHNVNSIKTKDGSCTCYYGEQLQRCSPDSTNGSVRINQPSANVVENTSFHSKTGACYYSAHNKSPDAPVNHNNPVSWRQPSFIRNESPDSQGQWFAYASSHSPGSPSDRKVTAPGNVNIGGVRGPPQKESPLAQAVPVEMKKGFPTPHDATFASKGNSDVFGNVHIPRNAYVGNVQYLTNSRTPDNADGQFLHPQHNESVSHTINSHSFVQASHVHSVAQKQQTPQPDRQSQEVPLPAQMQRDVMSRNLIKAVERHAATAHASSGGSRAMESLLKQSAVRQGVTSQNHGPQVYSSSTNGRMYGTEKESDPEQTVDISKYSLPLTISIPSNGSHMNTDVKVEDAVKHPKHGSKKHIIMQAVSQDRGLRQIVLGTERRISDKKSCVKTEETRYVPIFSAPSSPPSPKMPILSPQHKLPPPLISPVINEPPTLEPPSTTLSTFISTKLLPDHGQTVKRYLEVPHLTHSLSIKPRRKVWKGYEARDCSSPPPPVLTAQTEPNAKSNKYKSTFPAKKTLLDAFPDRQSNLCRNIPVANVAPIIQKSTQRILDKMKPMTEHAASFVSTQSSPQRQMPILERTTEVPDACMQSSTPMPSLEQTSNVCSTYKLKVSPHKLISASNVSPQEPLSNKVVNRSPKNGIQNTECPNDDPPPRGRSVHVSSDKNNREVVTTVASDKNPSTVVDTTEIKLVNCVDRCTAVSDSILQKHQSPHSPIKKERNIWASISETENTSDSQIQSSDTSAVLLDSNCHQVESDGKLNSLRKLSPLMKKMLLQKQLSQTLVSSMSDGHSQSSGMKSQNIDCEMLPCRTQRTLGNNEMSAINPNATHSCEILGNHSETDNHSKGVEDSKVPMELSGLTLECSGESRRLGSPTRHKGRRSLLNEIANSEGYIVEAKGKPATDDLLVDPSLLGREERALRRAIELFTKMEQKREQKATARHSKTTASRKADQLRKKARQSGHSKLKRRIWRKGHQGCGQSKYKGFVDFQPEVLESRTRKRELGRYDRNAAYEKELRKEESRHAARRRARLRMRARILGQKFTREQKGGEGGDVNDKMIKKREKSCSIKKICSAKPSEQSFETNGVLTSTKIHKIRVPKMEVKTTKKLTTEMENSGEYPGSDATEKCSDNTFSANTDENKAIPEFGVSEQMKEVCNNCGEKQEMDVEAEVDLPVTLVSAVDNPDIIKSKTAVHNLTKSNFVEPLVARKSESDSQVTESSATEITTSVNKSGHMESVKHFNITYKENQVQYGPDSLSETHLPLIEEHVKEKSTPSVHCETVPSLLQKSKRKYIETSSTISKDKIGLNSRFKRDGFEHCDIAENPKPLTQLRCVGDCPVTMTTRLSGKSEKDNRRARLRDRARKLGEHSNLRIRNGLKPSQTEGKDKEGIWEIRNSSSSLKQTLRNGKSKGGLMIKLSWKPNQGHCFSRRRETRSCTKKTVSVTTKVQSKLRRGYIPARLSKHKKGRGHGIWKSRRKSEMRQVLEDLPGIEQNDIITDDKDENEQQNLEELLRDHLSDKSGEEHLPIPSDLRRLVGEEDIPIPSDLRRLAISKNSGETLLHRAARRGYEEVALYYLTVGSVDVNARDNAGFTPLHETCVRGNLAVARHLLLHGADVNCASQDGIRPIHDALENDHIEIVRLLLSYGADLTLSTYAGKTSENIAHSERMKILIKGHMADVNGPLESSETLHWDFYGSSDMFDGKGESGHDIFWSVPADPEEETDDLFEFSSRPIFQTFQVLLGGRERCESCVFLSDVLHHFGLSRYDFDTIAGPRVIVRTVSKDRVRAAVSASLFRDRYLKDCMEPKVAVLRSVELTSVLPELDRCKEVLNDLHGEGHSVGARGHGVGPECRTLLQDRGLAINIQCTNKSDNDKSDNDGEDNKAGRDYIVNDVDEMSRVNLDYKTGNSIGANCRSELLKSIDLKSVKTACTDVNIEFKQYLKRSQTILEDDVFKMKVGTVPEECFDDFVWTPEQSGCDSGDTPDLVKEKIDSSFLIDR